jgi:hypothetical protein
MSPNIGNPGRRRMSKTYTVFALLLIGILKICDKTAAYDDGMQIAV